ncbi:MAG: tol-pal system protein YbgF [Desulfobacterales bacterium]|nr:tol-pal system protein YbgF [Desulfobacterales bacterium]
MNKRLRNGLLLLILTPFLQQCIATTQDVQNTNLRVRYVDQEVKQIREGILREVQARQAKVDNRLDSLHTDLLGLKGQMEENAYNNRRLHEENKEMLAGLRDQAARQGRSRDQRLARLDKKLSRLDKLLARQDSRLAGQDDRLTRIETMISRNQGEIESIKKARAREAVERAMEAARAVEEARKARELARVTKTKKGVPELIPDKHKKKVSPGIGEKPPVKSIQDPGQGLYDKALDLFRQKKYQAAHDGFAAYLDKNPNGKLKVNARFWMGDSLFNQQEYELAILEYQKVISDFPYHAKAPAALLKQGLAFEKLGDRETARIVLRKLVAEYPKSDQAGVARKRLRKLK